MPRRVGRHIVAVYAVLARRVFILNERQIRALAAHAAEHDERGIRIFLGVFEYAFAVFARCGVCRYRGFYEHVELHASAQRAPVGSLVAKRLVHVGKLGIVFYTRLDEHVGKRFDFELAVSAVAVHRPVAAEYPAGLAPCPAENIDLVYSRERQRFFAAADFVVLQQHNAFLCHLFTQIVRKSERVLLLFAVVRDAGAVKIAGYHLVEYRAQNVCGKHDCEYQPHCRKAYCVSYAFCHTFFSF